MKKCACLHCGRVRWIQTRKLCKPCHETPAVRERYACVRDGSVGRVEPNAAELDALIAEQMRCLPAWFGRETLRERERVLPVLPCAVLLGRGLRLRCD